MDFAAPALALLAGLLSIFSPCVLPLVPIVVGTAMAEHKLGPVALAAGLALSFLAIGLFLATIGFSLGIDDDAFRMPAAILLMACGGLLLVPRLRAQVALAAGPVGDWAERRFSGLSVGGLGGQFAIGLLLGAVWTPCVGPTLGAASVLAAQGRDLGQVGLTMLMFALGIALPLLFTGLLSREAFTRWRGRLLSAGRGGNTALGGMLAISGALILSGLDRALETALVQILPSWMWDLTTRF
jgi:cytochrome c biogenesis protein CcdA